MKRYSFKILLVWVVILSILYSTLSILRHNHFESGGFDLGIYDQEVWQYSKFLSPYNTIKDRFILGDHLTLTLPLVAPLFWIWSDARILLIFQAFWVSLSSIAIYKLTRLRKFSETTALSIAIIYSLFYGIQFLIFFDFHPVAIGVGLLPWVAYFLESKRKKLLIISVMLLLFTQENMGIALAGLGLVYFFHKKFRKTGILFGVIGIVATFISAKIIASLSPAGFQYWPQTFDPRAFFDSNEKRQVWFYSFTWFSFLPVLSPGAILAVILDLAQYFITGPAFSRMWSPYMHHRAILAPFLVLGIIEVLGKLKKKQWVLYILLLSALFQQYYFHFPLNKLVKTAYWREEQWMRDDEKLISLVPQNASVATQQNLVPHLSERKEIYLVYPRPHDFDDNRCGQRSCWWLDFAGKPQYLVVDLRPGQMLTQILETDQHYGEAVANMEKAGKIVLDKQIGDAKIYRIVKNP